MSAQSSEFIFYKHTAFVQPPELERAEVDIPQPVVDLLRADVLGDGHAGDVHPAVLLPTDAAVGADVAHLESVGSRFVPAPRRIMMHMATASKRAPSSKLKQSPTPPTERSAPLKPFLRFYHSEALRKKTLSLLSTIEQAQDATTYRDALSNLVVELTNSGMDYYFIKPLKRAKPGFIVEQSANLGLAGVQQVMGSVVRQIIGRMDSPQLISVCGSIRQLML